MTLVVKLYFTLDRAFHKKIAFNLVLHWLYHPELYHPKLGSCSASNQRLGSIKSNKNISLIHNFNHSEIIISEAWLINFLLCPSMLDPNPSDKMCLVRIPVTKVKTMPIVHSMTLGLWIKIIVFSYKFLFNLGHLFTYKIKIIFISQI